MAKNPLEELLVMVTDITNRLKDIDDYETAKAIIEEIEDSYATLDCVKTEIRGDSENVQVRLIKIERKLDKIYDLLRK